MNIDWKKIKKGFSGFEHLAVTFVQEHEQMHGESWIHTKETRDKNHDAIISREIKKSSENDFAIFVGYSGDIDAWWMEAKYSAIEAKENKIISRYRLDATIVSALQSKMISKIIFVTNLNISSKTVSDIRHSLISYTSCREVIFYTRNHLEDWLLSKNYNWFKKYFAYTNNEYNCLDRPLYNCMEELSFYEIGENLFQEPLTNIYSDFIYEIHFSISVRKDFEAKLEKCVNIELPINEADNLKLKTGINEYVFRVKIPHILQYEPIYEKDVKGEYKAALPISLIYILSDSNNRFQLEIIPSTYINIICSDYYRLSIPSQNDACKQLYEEMLTNIQNQQRHFSLTHLFGKSGVGKSYVLQLFRKKVCEYRRTIICYSYNFTGEKLDDITLFKKFVFNLLFPFIFYEDLDDKYIQRLQQGYQHLKSEFWDFIYYAREIEEFVKFCQDFTLLSHLFPCEISINARVVIFDDVHKLPEEYLEVLDEIIRVLIKYQYPIFCIVASQKKFNLEKYRLGKIQNLYEIELSIKKSDVLPLLEKKFDFIDTDNFQILFGSMIEIVYFLKYLMTLGNSIKNIADFKLAYCLYKDNELLKNELISKFKNVFALNPEAEGLCSCIYYASSGIQKSLLYKSKKERELINILLDAELIKKNENDFYVCWHDYYKEIYINHFPLKMYPELNLPFDNIYDIRLQFELNGTDDTVVKDVIAKLQKLYAEQKYYSIYYILENVFLNKTIRDKYKYRINTDDYFLLFAYFCYANTNAGTIYSGYDMFEILFMETSGISDITVLTIRYIILWELINSLYENDKYDEVLEKISLFDNIAQNIQDNWITLFGWDYTSLKYAVTTVKIFIDSESGINCLNRVPAKEKLPNKDVAFSTYRLLLCNLTNDFAGTEKILREYNKIIQNSNIYDAKTKYMYNFTVIFLDCINNVVDISEVIKANELLKNDFFNDYNRHIFIIAILALLKGNISLCEKCRLEYIKTKRPMRVRQLAFQSICSALVNLYRKEKKSALEELFKAKKIFEYRPTYLTVIIHNIEYIKQRKFALENVDFYFGQSLNKEKYYIDIRMLY